MQYYEYHDWVYVVRFEFVDGMHVDMKADLPYVTALSMPHEADYIDVGAKISASLSTGSVLLGYNQAYQKVGINASVSKYWTIVENPVYLSAADRKKIEDEELQKAYEAMMQKQSRR